MYPRQLDKLGVTLSLTVTLAAAISSRRGRWSADVGLPQGSDLHTR
jgi:hypothetical protein